MTNKKDKLEWADISLHIFEHVRDILEDSGLDEVGKESALVEVIYGLSDVENININEYNKLVDGIGFLCTDIPDVPLKNVYEINGTKYTFNGNVFKISAGQFFDWRQCIQVPEGSKYIDYAEAISVFMVPEGRKYNDGYDMEKVVKDIKTMSMPDIMKIFGFFQKELQVSLKVFRHYLYKILEKLKKDLQQEEMEAIETAMKMLEQMEAQSNMTYSHTT